MIGWRLLSSIIMTFTLTIALAKFYTRTKIVYKDRVFHREEEFNNSKTYKDLCENATYVVALGLQKKCREQLHIYHQNPYDLAFNDTLYTYLDCEPFGDCGAIAQSLFKMVSPFRFILISIGTLILIAAYFNLGAIKYELDNRKQKDFIPTTIDNSDHIKVFNNQESIFSRVFNGIVNRIPYFGKKKKLE